MKKHYRHENNCLNCGTILQGHFCHNCGQENLEIKESFGHVMGHTISDYFHFDHQFFGTIKPLLFKPGFLTVEYMAGRRIRYLHPIKTYIFISVVYFLLLFQSGHEEVKKDSPDKAHSGKLNDSVANKIAKNPQISSTAKQKMLTQDKPAESSGIHVNVSNKNIPKDGSLGNATFNIEDTTYQEYLNKQAKLPPAKQDGFIWRAVSRKLITYREKYGNLMKEVLFEEFKHNIPKMMFLLLPIAAVIVGITFRKSKKYYIEHLIYTFNLHCFLFLFLTIVLLIQKLIPFGLGISFWIDGIAAIYIAWYIYRSLRVVYHRNPFRTITKMIGMSVVYLVAFLFCFSLVLLFTAIV